ncbi:deoxyhypusine synthase family protein [Candidatus Woesearchaeota archaeon]|nr:deoxyhypusine synthase family protein [Candidatus Woesearchaeota archaeon]
MTNGKPRSKFHDGESDGLEALEPLDLSKIEDFDGLAKAMSKTALGGRQLGEAVDVLYEMKDKYVVLTLTGIMTIAKQGLIICDLIEKGVVNAVVSTGALITHGFIENAGMKHYKCPKKADDKKLYSKGYDRIYDTLELEANLNKAEAITFKVFEKLPDITSSREINYQLGKYLVENEKGRGVLKSAYEKKVPVYIPAFTDSELGLDFALYKKSSGKKITFDPFRDLEHITNEIVKQDEIGIFTIGGGVPRNWSQQIGPYLDAIQRRFQEHDNFVRYKYGVRICPEPEHWGGLSGCSYSEGVSWGKFVPEDEGGRYAEVFCDASIALPLIAKALFERIQKNSE